jgi:4-oxalocrotonate tautomerase family enzyme
MPIVEMKLIEDGLTPEREVQLIAALTDAVVSVYGEPARDKTWVVLEPVERKHWGFAGRALPPA